MAEKRAGKVKAKPLTFAECVAFYAEVKLCEFSSDKHRREWVRSIERLAFPAFANVAVQDIKTRDILRML